MLALKITDLKAFTGKLFTGEAFDRFWLTEASITTGCSFSIDGKLHKEFYDSDELEMLKQSRRTYALWKEIKPLCHNIIRGRHTPLAFKIILQLSHNQIGAVLEQAKIHIPPEAVQGLYLNLQYKNRILMCTTGVSFQPFVPDKELERHWDAMIRDFFQQNQIAFEEA